MIGQDILLNKIHRFTHETFPQSSILEGEYGCGKKTLVQHISSWFAVPVVDISTDISSDLLLELYSNPLPCLYMIDIDKASNSKKIVLLQNAILKFIEEPPQQARIIILCENRQQLLPTIQNRCRIFSFEKYTRPMLKGFAEEHCVDIPDELLSVYNTPGKILTLTDVSTDITSLLTLVDNVLDNIYRANLSNILTIVNKIDFGNGGYNLDIFLHMIKREIVQKLQTAVADKFRVLLAYYKLTSELSTHLKLLGVNRQSAFENYLMKLKMVTE